MIESGDFNVNILATDDASIFHAEADYKVKIKFYGTYQDKDVLVVPEFYFSEEFLVELRETGFMQGPNFKVEHRGFADATDELGVVYWNCDKLYFYDIDSKNSAKGGEIQNAKILAHVSPELPGLGAVTLDMAGEFKGIKMKMGADYTGEEN